MAQYETIREAAEAWVNGFNEVPSAVLEKLMRLDFAEVREITPPSVNDRVYIFDGEFNGQAGTITGRSEDEETGEMVYTIDTDNDGEATLYADQFEVSHEDGLPMWSTLWAFGSGIDDEWVERGGLQAMADCGFRIYEQEDYGHVFGIDGAGYSFYEAHWIPLYKARGLHWHHEEAVAA